ncbi:MAG: anhydro-N-acetylmuramic acid kinase [Alphaproteobacteria bacterium]|nr:anhydro-N-acetylmuramic acid kinase [Alphaproteobacteria bacterium]
MYYIGIMTGNSLDAVDVVITDFEDDIKDICAHSIPIPQHIADSFRILKNDIKSANGDIVKVYNNDKIKFLSLHDEYIKIVAQTVNQTIKKANLKKEDIKAIGFHGQTCYHNPPSINTDNPNTLQIGSGQMLADITGIPVAYDFRSDDIMNGGEGAPLAPIHNQHLALSLKEKGVFPLVFLNAGNTGNLSVISNDKSGNIKTYGWDTGPFNHFIDHLARNEKNTSCDFDGKFGQQGNINYDLLRNLFEKAVVCSDNSNFITKLPPKSSDPAWYKILPELNDKNISFFDRIRTAEFFSAYIMVYNLKFISPDITTPKYFITFGGGWKNPIVLNDFKNLLTGKVEVLPEHKTIFESIHNKEIIFNNSDSYGYSAQFMEARIFADMAYCLDNNIAYSTPETTGCKTPTVCGIFAYPNGKDTRLWSRASYGWQSKKRT